MEFALPELLTREDILNILRSRHLNIPNLHDLCKNELERLYKTFIMPLSRRPQRNRRSCSVIPSLLEVEKKLEDQMEIDVPLESCNSNSAGVNYHQRDDNGNIKVNKINLLNEKRQRRQRDYYDDIVNDYQLQLSSATKRIKIHSSI